MIHKASKIRLFLGTLMFVASCTVIVGLLVVLPDGGRWLRMVLMAAALTTTCLFMVSYHLGTRGFWRRSDIGVHLMVFAAVNALVLLYVLLAFLGWIPLEILPYLSALTYWTMAWLFGWRTVIMRGYLRGGRGSDGT